MIYTNHQQVLIKKTSKSQHKEGPKKLMHLQIRKLIEVTTIQFYRVIIAMSEIFSIFAT